MGNDGKASKREKARDQSGHVGGRVKQKLEKVKGLNWVAIGVFVAIGFGVASFCQNCQEQRDVKAGAEPRLEVYSFVSGSTDLRDEDTIKKIERNRFSVEALGDVKEWGGKYACLLIQNKGKGLATILSIEVGYNTDYDGGEFILDLGEDGTTLLSGETLAVVLGRYGFTCTFTRDVVVTYTTQLSQDPITKRFSRDGIKRYVMIPPTIRDVSS